MFIEELKPEQKVRLIVKLNNNVLEFETVVKMPIGKKNHLAIDVIRKEDKLITFKAKGLLIDLIYEPNDNPPVIFKSVTISVGKDGDNLYYIVYAPIEGKTINRRQNYRVYIGEDVVAQFGINRKPTNVILKDISSSGFAVVVQNPREPLYEKNQLIHVVFSDRIEEACENYSFHLNGMIVRVVPLENDKGILYGCILTDRVAGLEKYLTAKERLRIKQARNN